MKKFALISVYNKEGLVDFVRSLVEEFGFRILSTGGTARLLKEHSLPVTEISAFTGVPEMLGGRVKSLHPKIYAGLLCRRDHPADRDQIVRHGIELIDLVAVNFYPFEEVASKSGAGKNEILEMIDIGGPCLLRAAAKNHARVTAVCDPSDYGRTLTAMREEGSELTELRTELAMKAFQRCANYDSVIERFFSEEAMEPDMDNLSGFPKKLHVEWEKSATLRYGENPHQAASLYGDFFDCFEQLQGKPLSYNNILDTSAAAFLIGEFKAPAAAILKHANPCGAATADDINEAWEQALETDREAAFGGVHVFNRTVDGDLAENMRDIFCEVVIAPGFQPAALDIFRNKKNLRLLVAKGGPGPEALREIRSVAGGVLAQDIDRRTFDPVEGKIVTKREPTPTEWSSLLFAWKVVKHVKSNAIVLASDGRTMGIGAGQMSRVDAVRLAVWKMKRIGEETEGSIVVASDGFFPFADGLERAAQAGATAAIQPGGSIRDKEVIKAADSLGMAMVFTGFRHFRH